jgi:hypothetical protein
MHCVAGFSQVGLIDEVAVVFVPSARKFHTAFLAAVGVVLDVHREWILAAGAWDFRTGVIKRCAV